VEAGNYPVAGDAVASETRRLFAQHRQTVYVRTDRLFAALLAVQWVAGTIGAAASHVGPRHSHLWAAMLVGGALCLVPAALGFFWPGRPLTRYCISAGQILTGSLLVELTDGRFEAQYVFGFMAVLALYRDWRVLLTATIVVVISVVVERSGPFIGALIAALPTAAGAAYIILAFEHPPDFIAASAVGSAAATATVAVFALTYTVLAQRHGLVLSLGAAMTVWFAAARNWMRCTPT